MRLPDRKFQEQGRSVWDNPRRFSEMNFRATKFRDPNHVLEHGTEDKLLDLPTRATCNRLFTSDMVIQCLDPSPENEARI